MRRFGVRFSGVRWIATDAREYMRQSALLDQLSAYLKCLTPYLACDTVGEKARNALKLEHKDIDGKRFGADVIGRGWADTSWPPTVSCGCGRRNGALPGGSSRSTCGCCSSEDQPF